MSAADIDLALLQSWQRRQTSDDVITLARVRALAATLDYDPDAIHEGALLPPLYHWLFCLEPTRSSDLAHDGHETKGEFMPPVPFPRRMFAGARIDFVGELRIGERLQRISEIKGVRYTEGRSGPLVFVTVLHKFSNDNGTQLIEEQDIVYRPADPPKTGAPKPVEALPDADWSREVEPDEPLLFRFSALTFNAHRIHYDLPYAKAEGYSALVIHGPLTAMLLADLVSRECAGATLQHFEFRGQSAFCLGEQISLLAKMAGDTVELTAVNDKRVVGMSAQAILR